MAFRDYFFFAVFFFAVFLAGFDAFLAIWISFLMGVVFFRDRTISSSHGSSWACANGFVNCDSSRSWDFFPRTDSASAARTRHFLDVSWCTFLHRACIRRPTAPPAVGCASGASSLANAASTFHLPWNPSRPSAIISFTNCATFTTRKSSFSPHCHCWLRRQKPNRSAADSGSIETKQQLARPQEIFNGLGESPEGKTCKAMAGLIAEAKEALDHDADPEVMDAVLIVVAQEVEHYEIAGYGSASTFARVLNDQDAARLLEQTLAEEERMDEKLTQLSEQLNAKAATADQAAT